MCEEWRAVEVNPNYEVSDRGNVRHVKWRGREVMPYPMLTKGYLRVNLSRSGVAKQHLVHRLVCVAFHGPQPEGMLEVDHINYDRADNRASNLRWINAKGNSQHSYHRRASTLGADNGNAKLSDENVREIKRIAPSPEMYASIAARFGVSPSTIRNVRRGRTWAHIKPVPADDAAPLSGRE